MKKLLTAAAFAALVASPAFAQTYLQPAPGAQARMYAQPQSPYATPFDQYQRREMWGAIGPSTVVSVDGQIVGQDPDPRIRSDLARNADQLLGRGSD
jgi:hypothetical protein